LSYGRPYRPQCTTRGGDVNSRCPSMAGFLTSTGEPPNVASDSPWRRAGWGRGSRSCGASAAACPGGRPCREPRP